MTRETKVEDMELRCGTWHALKRGGINTAEDILKRRKKEVLKIRQIGPISVEEIERKLKASGLIEGDWGNA